MSPIHCEVGNVAQGIAGKIIQRLPRQMTADSTRWKWEPISEGQVVDRADAALPIGFLSLNSAHCYCWLGHRRRRVLLMQVDRIDRASARRRLQKRAPLGQTVLLLLTTPRSHLSPVSCWMHMTSPRIDNVYDGQVLTFRSPLSQRLGPKKAAWASR